jgi:hypothetical protein
MKKNLLFICFTLLIGTITYSKNLTLDAVVNLPPDVTICPGNRATLIITGTPNCTVVISQPSSIPIIVTINIGAFGTAVFTTPILYQTTTFTAESVTEILTGSTTVLTGESVTVNVVPNGCTTVFTNSPTNPNSQLICTPGECTTLTASPSNIPSTATYSVSSIPYCPQAAFTDSGYTQINAINDDVWSPPVSLPFNFSFFGQNYSSCQVGSNGMISFTSNNYPGFCNWDLNSVNIPNTMLTHRNAIFGAFQDTDLRTDTNQSPPEVSINWTIIGTYPCRKLIVNFYHLGLYQCNQFMGLQTSQIVLYEASNIIEVYVQNRTRCVGMEDGEGVIGIINSTGELGYTPPGRNTNDAWVASNEAWRFTPSGPNVPMSFRWLEDGTTISNNLSTTVCPMENTTYVAEASYNIDGAQFVVTSPSQVFVAPQDPTQNPADLAVCYDPIGIYTIDLTANDATILGAASPLDYEIKYFTSLTDAENSANPISNPTLFSFTQNQVIYAGVMNVNYGCYFVRPFQLTITPAVDAPTGISPQTLSPGQTLADVVVTGQDVQWYDAPQDGNLLSIETVLQNNMSYYATQSVNNCESRTAFSSRLEIIVHLSLGTHQFDGNAFNLYPNPTSEFLTLTSNLLDVKLEIFNILSQKVESRMLQNGTNLINLSNYTPGVYLFQLSLDGKTKTYKIIKK